MRKNDSELDVHAALYNLPCLTCCAAVDLAKWLCQATLARLGLTTIGKGFHE